MASLQWVMVGNDVNPTDRAVQTRGMQGFLAVHFGQDPQAWRRPVTDPYERAAIVRSILEGSAANPSAPVWLARGVGIKQPYPIKRKLAGAGARMRLILVTTGTLCI